MAYNTGNPSGSSDPRDLSDSSADIDTWATSTTVDTHPDRLGTVRKTWHGMENEFDADQAARASEFEADQDSREAQFVQLMVSGGYTGTGASGAIEEYASGITVSAYKEIIRENGEFWRAAAGTTLPYTTTGAGMPESGAFVSVGDAALRQELASATDGSEGARLVQFAPNRTVFDKLNEQKSILDYGAIPGTDSTAAIQSALNDGFCLVPQNASGFLFSEITIPEGAFFCGQGVEKSSLVSINGDPRECIKGADASKWAIVNLGIYGNNPSASDTEHNGLVVTSNETDSSLFNTREWFISNVRLEGFGGTGFKVEKAISPGGAWGRTGNIMGMQITQCYRGAWFLDRGEYISVFGMHCWENIRGLEVQAGNVKFIGCQFDDNANGALLNSGINDHHGSFVGCSFNHNGNLNLWIQSSTKGQSFDDCSFFAGDIRIDNAQGISFNGGNLGVDTIQLNNNTGSVVFNDMLVREDSTNNIVQTGDNNYQFINCRDRNGYYPGNTNDATFMAVNRTSDLTNTSSPRTISWTNYIAKLTGGNDSAGKISSNSLPIFETGFYAVTVSVDYSISGAADNGQQSLVISRTRGASTNDVARIGMRETSAGSAGCLTANLHLEANDSISTIIEDTQAADGTRAVLANAETFWNVALISRIPEL